VDYLPLKGEKKEKDSKYAQKIRGPIRDRSIVNRLIEDTPTPRGRGRDGMVSLVISLRELYKHDTYRDRILNILEEKLIKGKPQTGRPGMSLWEIFVLAQIRLSKQLSYDELETQANYNSLLRQVMGVARAPGIEEKTFPYQTIVDNVSLLDDNTLRDINEVIVSFGHSEVFKKKRRKYCT
jgi:hypothetical protein